MNTLCRSLAQVATLQQSLAYCDMMMYVTRDIWVAALHRIILAVGKEADHKCPVMDAKLEVQIRERFLSDTQRRMVRVSASTACPVPSLPRIASYWSNATSIFPTDDKDTTKGDPSGSAPAS
jgi:hypothetical protein